MALTLDRSRVVLVFSETRVFKVDHQLGDDIEAINLNQPKDIKATKQSLCVKAMLSTKVAIKSI